MKYIKRILPFAFLLIFIGIVFICFVVRCNSNIQEIEPIESTTSTSITETSTTESTTDTSTTESTTDISTTESTTEETESTTSTSITELVTTSITDTTTTIPETTTVITTTEEITVITEETTIEETEVFNETTVTEIVENTTKEVDDEIVLDVIRGKYGNGCERRKKLKEKGYDYDTVQKAVDEYLINSNKSNKKSQNSTYENIGSKNKASATYYTGVYYNYSNPWDVKGGSGRTLIGFDARNGIKGSIASRTIYEKYGYNYNGKRTTVYLEFPDYSEMNGYYYLDDCCRDYNVVDVFVCYANNCSFEYAGRVAVYWSIVS